MMYFLLDYRRNRPEVVFASVYLDRVKEKRQQYLRETDAECRSLVLITKVLDEESMEGHCNQGHKTTL